MSPASYTPPSGGGGEAGPPAASNLSVQCINPDEEHVNRSSGQWLVMPTPDRVTFTLDVPTVVDIRAIAETKSPPGDWCAMGVFVDGTLLAGAGPSASQYGTITLVVSATGIPAAVRGGDPVGAFAGTPVSMLLAEGDHTVELRYYGDPCYARNRRLLVTASQ